MVSFSGFSRHECSPESYALVYALVGMAIVISVGGIFVWRRYIRTRPDASV